MLVFRTLGNRLPVEIAVIPAEIHYNRVAKRLIDFQALFDQGKSLGDRAPEL
jgi:hypothetical protein